MEQQKFSLFELERINIEELKNQFSKQIDETDNLTRYNIALYLEGEGRLKDCPLLSNDYDRQIFENVLKSEFDDEQRGIVAYLIPEFLWESNRILCIYMIYSENLLVPDWYNKENKTLFEYPIYYDESYFEEIHNLRIDDLFNFIEIFEEDDDYEYYWVYTHLLKELAKRIYYDVRDLSDDFPHKIVYIYDISKYHEYFLDAHLYVLAREKKDNTMRSSMIDVIRETQESSYGENSLEKLPFNFLYDLNPNVQTTNNDYDGIELLLGALSSVMKTSPYSEIDYKTFIDISKYALNLYKILHQNVDCNDFFSDCIKRVKTDKARKYLLAAVLNICGKESFMGSLVSKSNIVSHIPEGYYQ